MNLQLGFEEAHSGTGEEAWQLESHNNLKLEGWQTHSPALPMLERERTNQQAGLTRNRAAYDRLRDKQGLESESKQSGNLLQLSVSVQVIIFS